LGGGEFVEIEMFGQKMSPRFRLSDLSRFVVRAKAGTQTLGKCRASVKSRKRDLTVRRLREVDRGWKRA
jgi:hypothetical protein